MCVCVCVCVCVCARAHTRARVHAQLLSRVQFFVTPWIVVLQAPLSMGLFKKEYWSGLQFPTPGDLPNFLLQGIFPTQGSNPHLVRLLHWEVDYLPLHYVGSSLRTLSSV